RSGAHRLLVLIAEVERDACISAGGLVEAVNGQGALERVGRRAWTIAHGGNAHLGQDNWVAPHARGLGVGHLRFLPEGRPVRAAYRLGKPLDILRLIARAEMVEIDVGGEARLLENGTDLVASCERILSRQGAHVEEKLAQLRCKN